MTHAQLKCEMDEPILCTFDGCADALDLAKFVRHKLGVGFAKYEFENESVGKEVTGRTLF